jgi:excisionase family DNA binding protein
MCFPIVQPSTKRDIMKTLTVPEVCTLLKIHKDTLYQRVAWGIIPGAKIGRAYVFIEENLIAYLRGQYKCQSIIKPAPPVDFSALLLRPRIVGLEERLAPKSKRRPKSGLHKT